MSKAKKARKINIPELLAPAGNKEAFIAAVEAGADAVYLGGQIFNARMNAGNFSLSELKEAADFAHKRGVKVHVTLNTLLRDDELPEALSYAKELWKIGVDALIIQDLGLAALIHEELPDFEMHMSTQGTIYDLDGVRAAAKLGFSRVVLARELSLRDISEIISGIKADASRNPVESTDDNTEKRLVEIETFCHGALCYCYSGQCQMSRAIGGRSGNRGGCAQPCRMMYQSFDVAGHKLDIPYPLSPSDFELIEYLPEIAMAGVASIKIEGRMKSPEYVATVVSIYRKYLDMLEDIIDNAKQNKGRNITASECNEKGEKQNQGFASELRKKYFVSDEDRFALAQIFNRGFTTSNFLKKFLTDDAQLTDANIDVHQAKAKSKGHRNAAGELDSLMSGSSPKNRGVLVGRVLSCVPVSKNRNDRFLVDVEIDPEFAEITGMKKSNSTTGASNRLPLAKGDVIEVQDAKMSSVRSSATITFIEEQKQRAEGSLVVRIGDVKEKVFPGDSIYRLVSAEQTRATSIYFKNKDWHEGKYVRRTKLECDIIAKGEDALEITLREPKSEISVRTEIDPCEQSGDASMSYEERFKSSLSKTGGTPFEIEKIRFHGAANIALPVSKINEARRNLLSEMEEALTRVERKESEEALTHVDSKEPEEDLIRADHKESKFASEYPNETGANSNTNTTTTTTATTTTTTTTTARPESEGELELYFDTLKQFFDFVDQDVANEEIFDKCKEEGVGLRFVIPSAEITDANVEQLRQVNSQQIALYISHVSKGKEHDAVENNIDTIKSYCMTNSVPVYLGNIGQVDLFGNIGQVDLFGNIGQVDLFSKQPDSIGQANLFNEQPSDIRPVETARNQQNENIELRADYGINIYNQETFNAIRALGFSDYIESLEVDDVHFGAIPLMTIGHDTEVARIIDRKNVSYKLIKPSYSDQTKLVKAEDRDARDARDAIFNLIALAAKTKSRKRYYLGA